MSQGGRGHCKKRRLGSTLSAAHCRRRAERVHCRNYEERMSRGAVAGPSLQHAWISPAPRDGARASSGEQRRLDRIRRRKVQDRLQGRRQRLTAPGSSWRAMRRVHAGSRGGVPVVYCCRWSVRRRKWYSGSMSGRRVKGGREDATLTRTKVSDASNGHVGTHSGPEQDVRDVRNSQRGNLGLSPPLPIPSQLCHCRIPPHPQHQTCILPCCSSDAHLCLNTSSPPHDPPSRARSPSPAAHRISSHPAFLFDRFARPFRTPWILPLGSRPSLFCSVSGCHAGAV